MTETLPSRDDAKRLVGRRSALGIAVLALGAALVGVVLCIPDPLPAASSSAQPALYLHSTGSGAVLDATGPTASSPKVKDAPTLDRRTFKPIGRWAAAPAAAALSLSAVSDLHVWLGLMNSDDQGTNFDLRAELSRNGVVIATAETKNIVGVTRNPDKAKEVTAAFGPVADPRFTRGDVLALALFAKVTDKGGHASAVGLRLYYDAASRPARFGAALGLGNSPPVANAGPDQLVLVGVVVGLDGSASASAGGGAPRFRWSFLARPPGSMATLTDGTAIRPGFTADLPGRYVVQLVVNDGTANSQPDTVVIDTHDSLPVANAGPDQTVLATEPVVLDGSGATDPDKSVVAFGWSFFLVPNGSQAALSDPTAARPSFVADLPGAYVLHLVVNDTTADSAPDAVIVTAGLAELSGSPGDAANAHIPDIRFPAARPEEFTVAGGIPISRTTLGVIFRESTTVSAANSLIASINGQVIGGEPLIRMLLLSIPESQDLSAMMAVLEQLNARQEVAVAAPNALGVSRALPPHHEDQVAHEWRWDQGIPPLGANYGLGLIRAPQAWNLMTYGLRHGGLADVGIIEAGFDAFHPDLAPRLRYETFIGLPGPADDHGTHVSGIMAATWGNQLGVEGVAPHGPAIIARLSNYAGLRRDLVTDSSLVAAFLQDLQTIYRDILAQHPNVVAVNESFGLPCYDRTSTTGLGTCGNPAIDPQMTPVPSRAGGSITYAQLVDWLGDAYHAAAAFFAATTRSNFLVPAAVGYDSQPVVRVQDDSPMSNAAVRFPNGHYIAVEAIDRNNAYNPGTPISLGQMSFNLGGTVSAPGYGIRSAEITGGTDFDSDARVNCASPGDQDPNYATCSGTSQATPFVTGLIAYLWHLDPTLTVDQVRRLISDPAYTVPTTGGTRPRIDAFKAVMGIDELQVNRKLQEALVDVDDRTPDGNYREIRDDAGARVADYLFVNTADRRRGDGKISMADFRVFRDALVQVLKGTPGGLSPADVSLDGSPRHYKFDLNFDGCVGNEIASPASFTVPIPLMGCAHAPDENVFPRYDFNGDGQISDSALAPFKGSLLTDLDVLADLWPTDPNLNEGWEKADLGGLLPLLGSGSGDIEFRTHLALEGTEFNEIQLVKLTIPNLPMIRVLSFLQKRIVWTIPIDVSPISVKAELIKGGVKVSDLCFNRPMPLSLDLAGRTKLKHAEDTVVTVVSCAPPGNGTFSVSSYAFASIEEQLAGGVERSYQEQPIGGPPVDGLLGVAATEASASVTDAGFPSACPVHASASAGGRASLGVLSGSATAQADADLSAPPGSVTGLCPKDFNNLERAARGDAATTNRWRDTLTIVDISGLPAGTPVGLEMGVSATGNAASGSFFAYRVNPTTGQILSTLAQIFQGVEPPTARINTFVGDTISIVGSITVRVAAVTGGASNPSVGSSDSVVAQYHVAPLTPGASYTSASGQTYFGQ